ncbi:MAG TPA: hypothetical protein VEH62_04625 [Gemmatimonadales bacterium]|nr:hypothetical protein [Gemmatimonadales bacterium]
MTRALVALVLLALAAPARAQCPDGTPAPCAAAPARPAAPPPGSIAVLPFENRSPDSSDAYLADALPEEIFGRLARVQGLAVKSGTAVRAQWRRTPDPMAAARALRVQWFVTGTLRRAGGQLSVNAELVRAASGDGVWGAPFRRPADELASVEEQIAESVAVAVVGHLAPSQLTVLRRPATRNPEAYRLYLYGRTLMNRRTPADIGDAARAFQRATVLDPGFAAAWGRLGFTRGLEVQWGNPEQLPADSLLPLARAAADRALGLDSSLAEGWAARGLWALLSNDLGLAHEAYERSLRLDSLSADTWHAIGYLYGVDFLDLPEVARPYFRRALALDPDLRNTWRHLAMTYRDDGRLDVAEALLDTALARGPWPIGSAERSLVRFARGNAAGALSDLDAWDRDTTMNSGAWDGISGRQWRLLYRVGIGDSAGARRLVAVAGPLADSGSRVALAGIALGSAILGEREAAIAAIERRARLSPLRAPSCGPAPCSTDLHLWQLLHHPLLAGLRDDPRVQALLERTRPAVPWLAGH